MPVLYRAVFRARGPGVPGFGSAPSFGHFCLKGPGSDGAGNVHDDRGLLFVLCIEFVFDGGDGAEEQVAGVSHNGAAAGRDFVAREEFVEFGEGAVDGDGGSEVVGVADELGGDIGGVAVLFVLRGVLEAEADSGIGDKFAAAALTPAVLTTGEFTD
jgi:hypothetical protein